MGAGFIYSTKSMFNFFDIVYVDGLVSVSTQFGGPGGAIRVGPVYHIPITVKLIVQVSQVLGPTQYVDTGVVEIY